MTFLQKIGSAILKGIQIVSGIAPIAEVLVPAQAQAITTTSQDLVQIANIITNVEAIGQGAAMPLTGLQKLQAATPLVAQVILQSAMLAGHTIDNATLFTGGSQKIADGIADVLNSLSAAGVKTVSKS